MGRLSLCILVPAVFQNVLNASPGEVAGLPGPSQGDEHVNPTYIVYNERLCAHRLDLSHEVYGCGVLWTSWT